MNKVNKNDISGVLLKCHEDFINGVKPSYINRDIAFINRWSIAHPKKPVNLNDGTDVYLYVEEASNNQVKVIAQGIYRDKLFTRDDGIFASDTKRKATVKNAFALYNFSNGATNLDTFKKLLTQCNDNNINTDNIIFNDDIEIGITIITNLTFFSSPQIYSYSGKPPCSCGFRYITNIINNKMTFRQED